MESFSNKLLEAINEENAFTRIVGTGLFYVIKDILMQVLQSNIETPKDEEGESNV